MRPDLGDKAFRCALAQAGGGAGSGGGIHCGVGVGRIGGGDIAPAVVGRGPAQRGRVIAACFATGTPGNQIQHLAHADAGEAACADTCSGADRCAEARTDVGCRAVAGRQRQRGVALASDQGIGLGGIGGAQRSVQGRAAGVAAQLLGDHCRQTKPLAVGQRLGHLLVVHLAEHLVFTRKHRVAGARIAHALDQHLRELAFELT